MKTSIHTTGGGKKAGLTGFLLGILACLIMAATLSQSNFNTNQFAYSGGANGTVSIRSGSKLTNSVFYGTLTGDAGGLTGLYASNVFSGGQLPLGTVATNTGWAGAFLGFNGSRLWTDDLSTGTNLNASALASGTVADARLSANIPLKNSASNNFTGDAAWQGGLYSGTLHATNITGPYDATVGAFLGTNGSGKAGFSANGAPLTNLTAANLSGTIADARLSANVPLLNANDTWTGTQTWGGVKIMTSPGAGTATVNLGLDVNNNVVTNVVPVGGGGGGNSPSIPRIWGGSVPPVAGTSVARFLFPGGGLVSGTETNVVWRVPCAMTVTNFYVQYGNLGANTNIVMTLNKNGSATAVTLTFNGTGSPGFTNDTHGASYSAGDAMEIVITGNSASAMVNTINFNLGFQYY